MNLKKKALFGNLQEKLPEKSCQKKQKELTSNLKGNSARCMF